MLAPIASAPSLILIHDGRCQRYCNVLCHSNVVEGNAGIQDNVLCVLGAGGVASSEIVLTGSRAVTGLPNGGSPRATIIQVQEDIVVIKYTHSSVI